MAACTQRAGTITPVNSRVICGGGSEVGVSIGMTEAVAGKLGVLTASGMKVDVGADRIISGSATTVLISVASTRGVEVGLEVGESTSCGETSGLGIRHPLKISPSMEIMLALRAIFQPIFNDFSMKHIPLLAYLQ